MNHNKDMKDDAPFFGLPGGEKPANYPQEFKYAPKSMYPPCYGEYKGDGKTKKD